MPFDIRRAAAAHLRHAGHVFTPFTADDRRHCCHTCRARLRVMPLRCPLGQHDTLRFSLLTPCRYCDKRRTRRCCRCQADAIFAAATPPFFAAIIAGIAAFSYAAMLMLFAHFSQLRLIVPPPPPYRLRQHADYFRFTTPFDALSVFFTTLFIDFRDSLPRDYAFLR